MRLNNLIILFVLILIGFTLPVFLKTNLSARSAQLNSDYSSYLITATEGAMDSVASLDTGKYFFSSQARRKKAVETFYEILIQCFNYERSTYKDLVRYYVPCIFMIDTDGFYIEYTNEYRNQAGMAEYSEVITPVNKWSKSYSLGSNGITGNSYTVEYHLDDTVVVTYTDPHGQVETIKGDWQDVYIKMGSPLELQHVFGSHETFINEKKEVIIAILSDQMEFYINAHSESANQVNQVQYQFTLPTITGEDWARLIDAPTLISFLQGVQTPYDNSFLNIYALAGSEVEKNIFYYISEDSTGVKYYHRSGCSRLADADKRQVYSMKQAAKHGAYPCQECVK